MEDTPSDLDDDFERVLAECIERIGRAGMPALDAVCAERPRLATRLAARVAALRAAGLLPVAEAGGAELFGRYRIVGTLGRGAMGVVYLADPLDGGPRVAVKACTFVGAGSEGERLRTRFLREARAAARLDHPHVVPVREVVEDEGGVFLVMDAVEGATLAEILTALRAAPIDVGALSVTHLRDAMARARPALAGSIAESRVLGRTWVEAVVRIVRDVALALDHVHSHGIVHRDVKPSNILLDARGHALLFDLGLARVDTDPALTRTGEFAGSPYYAAPEQVAGRRDAIDSRTDVYSLGVTLYELLALEVPFATADPAALFRAIATEDPPSLAERSPLVPRDLAIVCATALEKEPGRRYPTAGAFADDLDRLLDLRPIVARAPGLVERGVRALRRRPALAAAVGLLAVLVVGAPAALLHFNRRIASERDVANRAARDYRREAERNAEVSAFWEELVVDLDASGDDSTRAAAVEILRRGATWVGSERLEQPLSRALVLETLGRVHVQLGRPADALPLFDQALALRYGELSEAHAETATALYHLARTHLDLGHLSDARALAERSVAAFAAAGVPDHPCAALSSLVLGDLDMRALDPASARDHYASALDVLDAAGDHDGRRADALERLGEALIDLDDPAGATDRLRDSLEVRRGERRPRVESTASALTLLAELHARSGRSTRARDLYKEALDLQRRARGDVHPDVAAIAAALIPLLPPAADATGEQHAFAGRCLLLLARNESLRGEPDSGTLSRSIERLEASGETGRVDLAAAHADAARRHLEDGDLESAERSAQAGLDLLPVDRSTPSGAERLLRLRGEIALRRGDDADAAKWLERALAELERDPTASPRRRASAMLELADVLRRLGVPTEAREREAARLLLDPPQPTIPPELILDPAYPLRRGPPERIDAYDLEFQRGITDLQAGRPEEAVARFERCLELLPGVPVCSYNIACARASQGRVDGARTALDQAVNDGFGFRDSDVALLHHDPDLAPLRDTPAFAALLERVDAAREAATLEAAEPAFFVPGSVDANGRAGLLVVVHRHGSSKNAAIAAWRDVADRLGMVLVAPSGRYRAVGSGGASSGMTWMEDIARYERRAWIDDRPVIDAIAEARRRFRIDPARVYLAGEGIGGLIAFDVALRSPSSFGGVLLHGATIHLGLARDHSSSLRATGLRAVLVPEPEAPVEGLVGDHPPRRHADALSDAIAALGVDVSIVAMDRRGSIDRLTDAMTRLSNR